MLIVGPTKSGKSTLANHIARGWPRVLVFEPRLDDSMILPNSTVAYGVPAALRAIPGRVIYRPVPSEFDDLPGAFDELLRKLWLGGGGSGVLVHETAMVAPVGRSGRYLRTVTTQGRLLGAGASVPMIFVTQRPKGIELITRTEAEHVFLFGLRDPEDLALMASVMGTTPRQLPMPAERHAFYYRGPTGEVRLMPPLRLG